MNAVERTQQQHPALPELTSETFSKFLDQRIEAIQRLGVSITQLVEKGDITVLEAVNTWANASCGLLQTYSSVHNPSLMYGYMGGNAGFGNESPGAQQGSR